MKNFILVAFSILLLISPFNAQIDIVKQVALSANDAWEMNNGNIQLNQPRLKLGNTGIVGLRFTNVGVPPGATINSAHLEFTGYDADSQNPSSVDIFGELDPQPSIFTNVNSNISSRQSTVAFVSWNITNPWTTDFVDMSSDVAVVIQELIDQPGWNSGNNMVLTLEATGSERRDAFSVDADPSKGVRLFITYTGGFDPLSISEGDVDNWNEAYDHTLLDMDLDPTNEFNTGGALSGNILQLTDGGGTIAINLTQLANTPETDPIYSASPAVGILSGDITNWNNAYGWGDHTLGGYVQTGPNGIIANLIPKWDGSALVEPSAGIYDIGGHVGIGTNSPNAKLEVSQDILVNSVNIGKGPGVSIRNTRLGELAFENNSSGQNNTAIGYNVLNNNTDGDFNTSVGLASLTSNTIGSGNTAIGNQALRDNIDGDSNVALGSLALVNKTNGSGNTAIGTTALAANINGVNNTAIGLLAGASATGSGNVFIGKEAGKNEISNNKLYIDNSPTSMPLIYGNFTTDELTINGDLDITGNGTVNGIAITSDRKYKTDINVIKRALDKVNALEGATYAYNVSKYPEKRFAEGTTYGFIAQDLRKVLPELVIEDDEGFLAINYDGVIPVLTEAIKEQQKEIESLKQSDISRTEMAELKERVEKQDLVIQSLIEQMAQYDLDLQKCCLNHQNGTGSMNGSVDDKAHLAQNVPNPFNEETLIRYYLPKEMSNAEVRILDLHGNLLQVFSLQSTGYGQLVIEANTLAPATYLYELIVNDERIDSKRMIID